MYGSLRFRDLKLGIHVPFSPCSRNPLHSFIPVVSVNLQDEKKKIWIKKKKNSSQVCDTLTLLKSSWLSSCQNWSSKFKIKNIDHRREASSCSESLNSNINLQAGNSQPNLHIRAIGMPMYWLGFAI